MLVEAGAGHAELRPPAPGRLAAAPVPSEAVPSRAVVGRRRQARWVRRYRLALIVLDVVIGLAAGVVMMMMRPHEALPTSPYAWLSVALPVVWPLALGFSGGYSPKFFGTGSEEFRKVARAGLLLLAAVSVVSYGAQLD